MLIDLVMNGPYPQNHTNKTILALQLCLARKRLNKVLSSCWIRIVKISTGFGWFWPIHSKTGQMNGLDHVHICL